MVHLRRTLRELLDELLMVTPEFLYATVLHSCMGRCLGRHCVGNLMALNAAAPQEWHKSFKSQIPGFLQLVIKYLLQMNNEARRTYLVISIDRATRWVYIAIKQHKMASSSRRFLIALNKICSVKFFKLLIDNRIDFMDRLFSTRER